MLQVLNLHISVLNSRLSLNKYDSSIFFFNVNRILHQMHYLYLRNIFQTQIKIICHWNKLVSSEYNLSANIYQILLTLHSSGNNKFKWIYYAKSILDDTGFRNIWNILTGIYTFLHKP
jgi:hypothetical protein